MRQRGHTFNFFIRFKFLNNVAIQGRKIYTHLSLSHERKKLKEDCFNCYCANIRYELYRSCLSIRHRMAFSEAVGCHLVQITIKVSKTIKVFFLDKKKKKSISQTACQLVWNTKVLKQQCKAYLSMKIQNILITQ